MLEIIQRGEGRGGVFPVQFSGITEEGDAESARIACIARAADVQPHSKKTKNGLEQETMTHLLVDWILVVQLVDKQRQTFRPIFGLQDAKKRNDVLSSSIANHVTRIPKCVQDSSFDKCDDFLGSAEDEAGIILEKVAGDGPDTGFLLSEGGENIGKIGYIVRRTGEAVEFLNDGHREKEKNHLRMMNETNER